MIAFVIAGPPALGDTVRKGQRTGRTSGGMGTGGWLPGESQAVSQPVNDKEERLAQALRANLHRRKAQSRARRTGEDDRTRHEGGLKAKAKPATGAEQDHGQAED